jgi:aminoglycoside phosphotransferase (APT) family kinase protein
VAKHSARSHRILAASLDISASAPPEVDGDDLVHLDLTGPNILFDDSGAVTGVVDWNLGAYRGDRHVALVKTRFEQEWGIHAPAPGPAARAAAHLDGILARRVSADVVDHYWAHRMLYQLYWAIQVAPTDVLDWHFQVAEARVL